MGLAGVVSFSNLRAAARSARLGGHQLEAAVEAIDSGDLEQVRSLVREAESSLGAAESRLRSGWLTPLRWIPFARTEVRAAEAGVRGARESSLSLLALLDFFLTEREPLFDQGRVSPVALEMLAEAVDEASVHAALADKIAGRAPDPRSDELARQLPRVQQAASDLNSALAGVAPLVASLREAAAGGDPYRVLVVFENGAELRATGGVVGFLGLVEIANAQLRVKEVTDVHSLELLTPSGERISVDAPADYLQRYGRYQANTSLWLNVNLSPDFPTVAGVAGRLYEATGGERPDAVIRLDLMGLGYLLGAYDDIRVDGVRLDPTKLAVDFLIDSYLKYPNPQEQTDYLSGVVDQVLSQVMAGADARRSDFVRAVRRAVTERRLAISTGTPAVDAFLSRIGADGGLANSSSGDVSVVVQNFGGNKLDLFSDAALDLSVTPTGCSLVGKLTLKLANRIPNRYLAVLPAVAPGDQANWWVSVYLPRYATLTGAEVEGRPAQGSTDVELGRPVTSTLVEVKPGADITLSFSWTEEVLGHDYQVRLQPQSRIVPATFSVNGSDPIEFVTDQVVAIPTDCKT